MDRYVYCAVLQHLYLTVRCTSIKANKKKAAMQTMEDDDVSQKRGRGRGRGQGRGRGRGKRAAGPAVSMPPSKSTKKEGSEPKSSQREPQATVPEAEEIRQETEIPQAKDIRQASQDSEIHRAEEVGQGCIDKGLRGFRGSGESQGRNQFATHHERASHCNPCFCTTSRLGRE